jgi:hypothetical protein
MLEDSMHSRSDHDDHPEAHGIQDGVFNDVPNQVAPAEPVSTHTKVLMLAAYSLLTAIRNPWLLLHGRIWAEEGTVYLRGAWSGSCLAAIAAPHLGYYALWPNAIALIAARCLPLQLAALFMTWCAFSVQVLAGYLIVQCEAFRVVRTKALALTVLLLTAPSYEVWLNTINSQFYLAVCAALVLISDPGRAWVQRSVVLAVAALTGPLTTILTPLFLLRALTRKSRIAFFQAALLTALAAMQIAVVHHCMKAGERHISFHPSVAIAGFFVQFIALPFSGRFGNDLAKASLARSASLHPAVTHVFSAGMTPPLFVFCYAMADVTLIGTLLWIVIDRRDRSTPWLMAASLCLGFFSIYGSPDGVHLIGERYVFSTAVLMGLSLLLAATGESASGVKKIAARILLVCFLFAGSFDYLTYSRRWVPYVNPGGADWYTQAKRWQKDANQKLSVWPVWFPQRDFTLPPSHE